MGKMQTTGSNHINEKSTTLSPWRKFWHLIGGSVFPVAALFVTRDLLFVSLGAVTAIFVSWEIVRFVSPNINRWIVSRLKLIIKKEEVSRPTGSTYLLIASLVVFFFFEKYVAITSLLFLSIGDFAAATIGHKFGRHRLFQKSLAGSLACFISCLFGWPDNDPTVAGMALYVVLAGVVFATVVEFLPIPLDDNLMVPVVSAGIMTPVALF